MCDLPDVGQDPGLLRNPETVVFLLLIIAMRCQRDRRVETVYLLNDSVHERERMLVLKSRKTILADNSDYLFIRTLLNVFMRGHQKDECEDCSRHLIERRSITAGET